jgi:kinesin family protein 5
MSEKEEHIRASLTKLDEAVNSDRVLSSDDIALLKRQLEDSQVQVNEGQERLRQNQDEIELLSRRKEELEQRLATLESEYEDLLDKTIHDEEANNADMARTVQDLKASFLHH